MNASDSYPLGDIPQIGIGIGKESITAKEYLQQYIYPDVRLALDQVPIILLISYLYLYVAIGAYSEYRGTAKLLEDSGGEK